MEQTSNEKAAEISQSSKKSITPVPLQLPKDSSKFAERYMSPTDRLISPVSKRILARNRHKGMTCTIKPELNVG
ncbi:uncharacterized protein A4U43_C03F25900 [Asparagus officinalis]|uniref:Uncharacterized protein n=1 Tax=Asparagus officinalis TaxID=4686 RepID=A0A5P1FDY8_ASPOF|nr:uncharacterized protein A4U43_C03F25900 [Asparagus officinalis]